MTKVVYNACHGGFGLSEEAMLRYAELKGIKVYPDRESAHFGTIFWLVPKEERTDDSPTLMNWDIERDDPALAQVVEEMGEKANDHYSKLEIIDIPSGTRYRVDEYDGYERIITEAEHTWKTA